MKNSEQVRLFNSWRQVLVFLSGFVMTTMVIGDEASDQDTANTPTPAENYQMYCAACHGKNLQGTSATALIKNDWQYGRSSSNIALIIAHGVEGKDMPAWKTIIPIQQIFALAQYIVDAQESFEAIATRIPERIQTQDYGLQVDVLGKGQLEVPWSIEFVNDKLALVTERSGRLRWMRDGVVDPKPIDGIPTAHLGSPTAGLMDIALDPDYRRNGWVYLAVSHSDGDKSDAKAPGMTRIVRGRIDGYRWRDQQVIFDVGEQLRVVGGDRWGSRLLFDDQGYLLFSIGDMNNWDYSQDLAAAAGKIYRVHPDGRIPKDNPFVGDPTALPAIFAYGVRNSQGIATHPQTGVTWFTDHGPKGGDELNILRVGTNYGWPRITYGLDYTGEVISEQTHAEGMAQPIVQWTPSKAVAPAEFVSGAHFSRWNGNLLVGSLAFEELWRYQLDGDQVVGEELLFENYGRIRDLKVGPDGAIYAVMNDPHLILRLTPAKENVAGG